MDVAVLGASGGSGRAITAALASRGHTVTAVNRRGDAPAPRGARTAAADLYDPAATRRVCEGAEVVVLAAMPPYHAWADNFDRLVDSVVEAVAATAGRLVYVDNLYMYGQPSGAISESSPERGTGKGALRRRIAHRILEEERITASVGRFSDYYGPGGTNSFVHAMFLEPAVAGRPMRVMLADDQPHTFHYLPDVARGFVTLIERSASDGRAWILPAAPALTQGELAGLVNGLLTEPVRVSRINAPMLAMAGLVSRQAREGRKVAHQFSAPWVIDSSAFEEAFGSLAVTDHRTAVAETLAWLWTARTSLR